MKRILYIEDSVTSQIITKRVLAGTGEIIVAPSPAAAKVVLAGEPVHLVITDYLFPEGDALDVVVPLRQQKTPAQVPVIAVSGSMDAALTNRLLKSGVNVCRSKPLEPAAFRALVERMLRDPFVESSSDTATTIFCFQWFSQGLYHEFCPELGTRLEGPDREEIAARMKAHLAQQVSQGKTLGFTTQEQVISYMV